MYTWLIVFTMISALPCSSKSMISIRFGCLIVRVNSTSRIAIFWSSMLWHIIRFNAYFRFVMGFSIKSITLNPLDREKQGCIEREEKTNTMLNVTFISISMIRPNQDLVNRSYIYPWAMRSLTLYFVVPICTVSFEHQHPYLRIIAMPKPFIVYCDVFLLVCVLSEIIGLAWLFPLSNLIRSDEIYTHTHTNTNEMLSRQDVISYWFALVRRKNSRLFEIRHYCNFTIEKNEDFFCSMLCQ